MVDFVGGIERRRRDREREAEARGQHEEGPVCGPRSTRNGDQPRPLKVYGSSPTSMCW
jgi:hypothetical protein